MVHTPLVATTSKSTSFDVEDRNLIDQIGLAIRVLEKTGEPDTRDFALCMLRDFSGRLGITGSSENLVAVVGEVLIKQNQSPSDREHVLGTLALFLNLVLEKTPTDADRQSDLAFEFLANEKRIESAQILDDELLDSANKAIDNQGHNPRTKESATERIATLNASGFTRVRSRGNQPISSAISKALETSDVVAVRYSGAKVDVTRVDGKTICLCGQIRDGKIKVRCLEDSTEGKELLRQFTFWANTRAI